MFIYSILSLQSIPFVLSAEWTPLAWGLHRRAGISVAYDPDVRTCAIDIAIMFGWMMIST